MRAIGDVAPCIVDGPCGSVEAGALIAVGGAAGIDAAICASSGESAGPRGAGANGEPPIIVAFIGGVCCVGGVDAPGRGAPGDGANDDEPIIVAFGGNVVCGDAGAAGAATFCGDGANDDEPIIVAFIGFGGAGVIAGGGNVVDGAVGGLANGDVAPIIVAFSDGVVGCAGAIAGGGSVDDGGRETDGAPISVLDMLGTGVSSVRAPSGISAFAAAAASANGVIGAEGATSSTGVPSAGHHRTSSVYAF